MAPLARLLLLASGLTVVLAGVSPLSAQGLLGETPAPFSPARPETREELDRREAVKLFGQAVVNQHNNRYLEAVRLYEEASRLDPAASLPLKSLVPLYLALDRLDDALGASRKALELDPRDHEGWHIYARQLRAQDRLPEAAEALRRALDCPALKDNPELHVQIAFDLAALHETRQEYDRAEAAYLVAARVLDNPALLVNGGEVSREDVDAQAAETYERLGRVCVKAGQPGNPSRATEYFLKAQQRVKERDPARARRLAYNLAEVRMARGEWAEALASLDDYLETQPQGLEAYRAKIQVLEKLGRRTEVLATLQRYAARDSHNVALRLLLADQHTAFGDPNQAETLYLDVARVSPGPEVYRGLFRLYSRGAPGRPARPERVLGLLNDALTAAEPADEDRPGDADAAARARAMLVVLREDPALVRALLPLAQARLTGGPSLHRQASYFLGILAARTQQLDTAEALFRAALLQASTGRGSDREHEIYGNLLRVLRLAHKHEAIVDLCRQGLARSRRTSHVLFRVEAAQALARLGKVDQALAEAAAAVEAAPDPNRGFAARVHAQILSQAGRHDEAAAECLALLKGDAKPEEVRNARHTLSVIYSAARDHARAEEQLRLILQADPNDATANNDLGYQWADQGKNLDEAERLIRKALDLDRKQRNSVSHVEPDVDLDNAAYIDSLGWVLFRRGQLDPARQELEKATALPDGADDPVLWDHLADVYHRQGESARAQAAWKKAVELYEVARERAIDDRYRDIKQKLKLLESATQR